MTQDKRRSEAMAVVLEPFAPKHFDTLVGWFSSERELVQWGGPKVSFPLDVAQLRGMLPKGPPARPEHSSFMASYRGRQLGHAQLAFDWRNEQAVLARVALAPEARGQGLGKVLVEAVVNEAFASGLARVELSVYPHNVPALRTYEELGFVREGTRRSSCRVEGERWDTILMGLLADEWQRGRGGGAVRG